MTARLEVGERVLVRGEPGRVVGPERLLGLSHVVAVVLDRDAFPRFDLVSNVCSWKDGAPCGF